jgi:rSAM/selenodomain-associated transferase 1
MMEGARVVVFAKAPVPGEVKTRLSARLGADGATRIYRALLSDTIRSVFTAPGLAGTLACAPAPDAFLSDLAARWGLDLDSQRGAGLFERLCDATRVARARGAGCVLFIGSDTPTLPRALVDRALERLASGADVVFGPSDDGGYTLVALGPRVDPEILFRAVPWDSDRALAATRGNAEGAGWRIACVPAWYDIDDPADLEYLRGHLAFLDPADPGGAPETRRVLAGLPRQN